MCSAWSHLRFIRAYIRALTQLLARMAREGVNIHLYYIYYIYFYYYIYIIFMIIQICILHYMQAISDYCSLLFPFHLFRSGSISMTDLGLFGQTYCFVSLELSLIKKTFPWLYRSKMNCFYVINQSVRPCVRLSTQVPIRVLGLLILSAHLYLSWLSVAKLCNVFYKIRFCTVLLYKSKTHNPSDRRISERSFGGQPPELDKKNNFSVRYARKSAIYPDYEFCALLIISQCNNCQ